MQAGKGAGLSEAFGGGGGTMQSLFGTKTTTVLAKVTIGLVILFLSTSILLTVIGKIKGASLMERVVFEEGVEKDLDTTEEELPVELPLNPENQVPVQ